MAPLVLLRASDPGPTSGIFIPGLRLDAASAVEHFGVFRLLILWLPVLLLNVSSLCSPIEPPSKLYCDSLGGEMG